MPGIHIPRRSLRRIALVGFSDDFNRADSATLGVSSSGHTWERLIDGFAIASNKAYQATSFGLEVIDSGLSDGYIQADVNVIGQNVALGFRASDSLNYLCFSVDRVTGQAYLVKFQAGAYSAIASSVYTIPLGAHVLKVTFVGGNINCLVDGIVKVTQTGITFNQTATKHGIGRQAHTADTTSTYDNVVCGP